MSNAIPQMTAGDGIVFDNVTQLLLYILDHHITDDLETYVMGLDLYAKRFEEVDKAYDFIEHAHQRELIACYEEELVVAYVARLRKFRTRGAAQGMEDGLTALKSGNPIYPQDAEPPNVPSLIDETIELYSDVFFNMSESDVYDKLVNLSKDVYDAITVHLYTLAYRRGVEVAEAVHAVRTGAIIVP